MSGDKGNSCFAKWMIDSGTTDHMTRDPKVFQECHFFSRKERVDLADGSSIFVAENGSLTLLNKYLVHNVLHIPHLPLNVLSISQTIKEDLMMTRKFEIGLAYDGLHYLPLKYREADVAEQYKSENEPHSTTGQREGQFAGQHDHLFGHVYSRRHPSEVVKSENTNPNSEISLDEPSPMCEEHDEDIKSDMNAEELPIAQRKGTRIVVEAQVDLKWVLSMQKETKSLDKNRTLEAVDIPEGAHLVGLKWVYTRLGWTQKVSVKSTAQTT
ncbi:uncharacterized protein LOC116246959 [Nymphaea colorata]|uniref:uncharacterized protein LOC116246959 n=1 Tax=Nymphaea colorata TaxID=210225 RepID=UPI00129E5102|nr:uncharacterized protein LOC116246959 [Nymphaea colorata]